MMDTSEMIDITELDLRKFIAKAYDLSVPFGMGMLHFQPGPLPEEMIDRILAASDEGARIAVSMDYVMGRAVKMTVFRDGDRLFIRNDWFDHSPVHLERLLDAATVQS